MDWLSQNWIWVVVLAGLVWLFARRGHGGVMGCCGHEMAHEGPHEAAKPQAGDAPRSPTKETAATDKPE